MPAFQQKVWRANLPRAFPVKSWRNWSEEKVNAIAWQCLGPRLEDWDRATKGGDVEALWQIWNQVAE
eukprot:11838530-Karenia_brevis.AAC.1